MIPVSSIASCSHTYITRLPSEDQADKDVIIPSTTSGGKNVDIRSTAAKYRFVWRELFVW